MNRPQNPSEGDRGWPPDDGRAAGPPADDGRDAGPRPESEHPDRPQPGADPAGPPAFGAHSPVGPDPGPAVSPGTPTPRPRPGLLVGAVVAWVVTGAAAMFRGLSSFVVAGNDQAVDDLRRQVAQSDVLGNVPADMLRTGLVIVGVIVAVLGALTVALALVMLTRRNWARVGVTVAGALAGLLSSVTVVGPLAAITAIVLQFLPACNAWFREPPGHGHAAGRG